MLLFFIDKFAGAIVALPLIMAMLFVTDRERFKKKWIWAALFVIYLNAMLIVVGVPCYKYISWDPTINWIPLQDFTHSNKIGMVLNIIMLMPFGAFLPIYFKRFQKVLPTVFAGVLMSFTIECLQLFCFRATDVDDIIMNTLGTLAGYFIGAVIAKKSKKQVKNDKDVIKLVMMILTGILVVVFINQPLMESILTAMNLM